MSTDHPREVSKSSLRYLSGTLLSRFSGMLRDMSMAFCFGAHPAIAAFMVSFRFANLIRRLFGEGSLPSAFIPHFEGIRSSDPMKGATFFRDLFASLTVFLTGLIIVAEFVLLAFIFGGSLHPDTKEILLLTALMLPGVLFICLFGLSAALLQCEKSFFIPGVAPIAFNIVWIGAVFWLKGKDPLTAMQGLSLAIVLAFFMQWAMTARGMINYISPLMSWKECFKANIFSQEVRSTLKPFALGIIGLGAMQINSALDAIFARSASLEGPAYLWYAIRIEQLPLALFGIALSSALLPPLSRAIKAGALEDFHRMVTFALKRSFSLILPCMFAILALGAVSINLVYGRGDFDAKATYQTIICLWGYGAGLLPSVFVLLFAPAFYAQKNYRIPTIGAVLSVILNGVLNAVMVYGLHWGPFSVAVATSIAAVFNCIFLTMLLSKNVGPLFTKEVLRSFVKTTICTLIATVMTISIGHYLVGDPTFKMLLGQEAVLFSRKFSDQVLQFFVMTGTFFLTFFSYAWMINAEEILGLVGLKRKESALE